MLFTALERATPTEAHRQRLLQRLGSAEPVDARPKEIDQEERQ